MSDKIYDMLETAGKPVIVGGIGATLYGALYGFTSTGPIMGMEVPGCILFGATSYLASLGGTATKNYVVPLVTNNPWGEQLVMVAAPVGTGLATAGLAYGITSSSGGTIDSTGLAKSFGIGAVSEIAGDYVWDIVTRR